jgi:hypothetical protein
MMAVEPVDVEESSVVCVANLQFWNPILTKVDSLIVKSRTMTVTSAGTSFNHIHNLHEG